MPEFSFNPPHTLFIDAALQAQDDSELISAEDRVNNEVSAQFIYYCMRPLLTPAFSLLVLRSGSWTR